MKSVHLRPPAQVGRRDQGTAEASPRPGGLPLHALDAKLLASPLGAGRGQMGPPSWNAAEPPPP